MASNFVPWYQRFFGSQLFKSQVLDNVKIDDELPRVPVDVLFELNSKNESFVVGIYFVSFEASDDEQTNQLIQLYNSVNTCNEVSGNLNCLEHCDSKVKKFEIIQVPLGPSISHYSQRNGGKTTDDAGSHLRLQHVPWYSVPTSEKDILERLTRRFEIKTLSSVLVLINGCTGQLITKHGLDKVQIDPTGLHFPWTPLPLPQIMENVDLVRGGLCDLTETFPFRSLSGLLLGFYFSAHWCPPCRCFTPQLKQTFSHLKKNNVGFQVIFVSSDRSKESFDLYLSGMPWLAVPYHHENVRLELAALFGVQGIPTLVITDSDGKVITCDGRAEVMADPKGLKFPWKPRLVNVLTDRLAGKLQDNAAVVLFIEGDEAEIEFAENVLLPAAKMFQENHEADERLLEFFIAIDTETSDRLRDVIGLDDAVPLLTIINLQEGTWSVLEEGAIINEEAVRDMAKKFFNNTLPTIRIGRR